MGSNVEVAGAGAVDSVGVVSIGVESFADRDINRIEATLQMCRYNCFKDIWQEMITRRLEDEVRKAIARSEELIDEVNMSKHNNWSR